MNFKLKILGLTLIMALLTIVITNFLRKQMPNLTNAEIANEATSLISSKVDSIIEDIKVSEISGFKSRKVYAALGAYNSKKSGAIIPYGYFILILEENPSGKLEEQTTIFYPGDYKPRLLFADLNHDQIVDLIIHAGEEDVFDSLVYMTSFTNENKIRFNEIYKNSDSHAYLYPVDLNQDGIPEFIIPLLEDIQSYFPNRGCLAELENFSPAIQSQIESDYSLISKNFEDPEKSLETSAFISAIERGHYFDRFQILQFSTGQSQDVTYKFKTYLMQRYLFIQEMQKTNSLTDDCKVQLDQTAQYLEESKLNH